MNRNPTNCETVRNFFNTHNFSVVGSLVFNLRGPRRFLFSLLGAPVPRRKSRRDLRRGTGAEKRACKHAT